MVLELRVLLTAVALRFPDMVGPLYPRGPDPHQSQPPSRVVLAISDHL
jgi:hypothetical protein